MKTQPKQYPQSVRLNEHSQVALDVLTAKMKKDFPGIAVSAVINTALVERAREVHEHKSAKPGCKICEALYG